ncbi:MAG: ribonuclease R [Candidatus Marinimicrobia bacterium]|nr:ribonuclease R [Candidatus Neomarinimicrobiota bacterium]
MDRSLIKKKLLDIMKQNQGRWYKPRDLMKQSGIRENDYHTLKGVLIDLYREGSIDQKGRHQYAFKPKQQEKTGVLGVTSRGFGFIELRDGSEVFVRAQDMQHALHGDLVRVKILKRQSGDKPDGQIIDVIRRQQTEFVGTYQSDRFGEWVIPEDKRIRVRFAVAEGKPSKVENGAMVTVELIHWDVGHAEPLVQIKEVLGFPGDPGLDIALIVHEHGLFTSWTQNALDQADSYSQESVVSEINRRKDLRDVTCFTIDPETAQDFDDAVSIEKKTDGWILGVHIADVSHYVTPGSPIDRGARKRGTSVYLVGTAIHMLPEKLASDLCSLNPDIDRLAMSCVMHVGKDAKVNHYEIYPSIINSKQRFSYQEVENIIQGESHHLSDDIHEMEKLRKILFAERKSRGSIDLDLPEAIIELDESGFPKSIKPSKRLTSHRLVEEFMLLANRVTAEYLMKVFRKAKLPGIYRVHEPPSIDDTTKLRSVLKRLGIEQSISSPVKPLDYQKLVEAVRESPFRHFIEKVALRSMTKAKYSVENKGHFGLAFPSYTHFTSPIRRYPDLTVHRLLKSYLVNQKDEESSIKSLSKLAEHCSQRERVAIEAERDHIKMKQLQYLSKHVGESSDGVISGVMRFGFFVELAETFVEGLVHASSLADDYYEFQEDQYSLVGRRSRKAYRLGDPVRVKVISVSISEGLADFAVDSI